MKNDLCIEYRNEFVIVYFKGEITCTNTLILKKELSQLIESTSLDIVFNFKDMTLIDSSGIGLVLGRYNQLKNQSRTLVITSLNSVCYRIFELTGLFQIMPYFNSIDEIREGSI